MRDEKGSFLKSERKERDRGKQKETVASDGKCCGRREWVVRLGLVTRESRLGYSEGREGKAER